MKSGLSGRRPTFTLDQVVVCENLEWQAPNGHLRVQVCLKSLDVTADGLITLPAKRSARPARTPRPRGPNPSGNWRLPPPGRARAGDGGPRPARRPRPTRRTIAEHHALGFRRPVGSSICYWIHGHWEGRPIILGAMLYGAPARHVAAPLSHPARRSSPAPGRLCPRSVSAPPRGRLAGSFRPRSDRRRDLRAPGSA